MTATTRTHAPIVESWRGTSTQPAEVHVTCTCGRFLFESQESISGGLEPWGDSWDEHITEAEQ